MGSRRWKRVGEGSLDHERWMRVEELDVRRWKRVGGLDKKVEEG